MFFFTQLPKINTLRAICCKNQTSQHTDIIKFALFLNIFLIILTGGGVTASQILPTFALPEDEVS